MVSNHLLFEYEEILKRDAAALGLSPEAVDAILNVVCARAQEWPLSLGWRPVLSDPDDEPLVQLAVESGTRRIVTHNLRDLQPATRLGVEVLSPRDFFLKLQETQ